MQKKNDLMSLLFFIVGLVAVVDLVFVQVQQQKNESNAKEKLDCVVEVVEGAQSTTGFNAVRDAALLNYLQTGNPQELRSVLAAPPPPLSDCEIAWDK
jgi:hypothetical protein